MQTTPTLPKCQKNNHMSSLGLDIMNLGAFFSCSPPFLLIEQDGELLFYNMEKEVS
jgi:hypothetical protein